MARGFVLGAIWGTVVAGLGAGAMSLMLGSPERGPSPVADMETEVLTDPEVTEAAAPEAATDTAPAPRTEAAPAAVTEPAQDSPPLSEEQAESAPMPEVETEPSRTAEPEIAGSEAAPATRPAPESDVDVPEQGAAGLDAPDAPETIARETESAAAPAIGDAPEPPEAVAAQDSAAPVTAEVDAPVETMTASRAPAMPAPDTEPSVSVEPAEPPMQTTAAETAPDGADEEASETEAAPEAEEPQVAVINIPVVREAESEEDTAGTGLLNRDPAVPQGRLPSIGDTAAQAGTSAGPGADSPLVRFAAKAEAAPDLPRMAILLIDEGSGPLGPEALESFPFPVSFAIGPGHPDAAATAQAYRERGFEVMAIADVPQGAQASDVEVILSGTIDAIPGAIGVLESPENGVQGSREISDQVSAYLADTGHGIVMQPKGLNTAQQLALKEGVPSATLFRDFDDKGQDAQVIRRFLDQAAFRARQEGAVIMLGRLRADTISALVLWGLQDRASSVALVPVSLVLKETVAE
ncbi:divergent polysaccharide deacetylase family protein [Primorskyibacter sp. 2E107]|uniref:divergent polysaccharide deacetylase family protein n=1 Tax=Primorskyibacter sp. 2E107 TaxID=3403458 RepID=UPI003AF94185